MSEAAYIFANGDIDDLGSVAGLIEPGRLVIAADGGIRHAFGLGLRPDVVIGDMDSAPRELLQMAERNGAEVIRYPARKDQTDLELALLTASDRGVGSVTLFGALGGRLDHSLANVMLLGGRFGTEMEIRVLESGYELIVVTREATIQGAAGDTVTLLTLSDISQGVTTEGLEYPLTNGSLTRGSSLGVSNVMAHERAKIRVTSGSVLAIHVQSGGDTSDEDDH